MRNMDTTRPLRLVLATTVTQVGMGLVDLHDRDTGREQQPGQPGGV
jgi:hypothetical protein